MADGISTLMGNAARSAGDVARAAADARRENSKQIWKKAEDVMTETIHAERTVTLTRVLKAPRELVWQAWTDPKMLKQWWGPENFTNPVVEGEIKEGGLLNITMRGPKGSPWDI